MSSIPYNLLMKWPEIFCISSRVRGDGRDPSYFSKRQKIQMMWSFTAMFSPALAAVLLVILSNGLESTSPFVVLLRKLSLLITTMDTSGVDTWDAILYAWDSHMGAFSFGRLCKGANGRPSHVAWNSWSYRRMREYIPNYIYKKITHYIIGFYRIESVQITWLGLSFQGRRQYASNRWRIE